MKDLLQSGDETNIYYVGLVLWHCGQKIDINIDSEYDYANVDRVFQQYNPGSEGYGKRVSTYTLAFYDYYN